MAKATGRGGAPSGPPAAGSPAAGTPPAGNPLRGGGAAAPPPPQGPAAPPDGVVVGRSVGGERAFQSLALRLANRHGLVAGATGTGKTVTLQTLAEGLSAAGVSVFAADVKGDLSGLSQPGRGEPHFVERLAGMGLPYAPTAYPVVYWDLFGEQGHPVRATVAEMGPLLLARLLELNEVQEGVLNVLFRHADEQGLLLLDLKDLRAMLQELGSNKDLQKQLRATYGNVTPQSIGAVQRQLLVLENQGADRFFGEPALKLTDFIATDAQGRGRINILAADRLMRSPKLYATFLLWMLSELFEELPEVGDLPRPKLCFFFDEAHLLFSDAPKSLLDAVEGVVRLIRSKGVGVYFVTQNPLDVPDGVLAQLGNRAQHALRAFTPRDQKAVAVAASTFRQNPALDTASAITQLGVGEALVSMLQPDGTPAVVSRALIKPPLARVGPVTAEERRAAMAASGLSGRYDTTVDRESAYETLAARNAPPAAEGGLVGTIGGVLGGLLGGGAAPAGRGGGRGAARMSTTEVIVRNVAGSMARQVGTQVARSILRGVLGGLAR